MSRSSLRISTARVSWRSPGAGPGSKVGSASASKFASGRFCDSACAGREYRLAAGPADEDRGLRCCSSNFGVLRRVRVLPEELEGRVRVCDREES